MKPTIKALAEKYGVDDRTLRTYRDEGGIDIYNEAEVELYMESLGVSNNAPDEFVDKDAFIEMKFKKLTHETNLKESESILKDLLVKEKQGDLINVNEVAELQTQIASKCKAQLKKLILSLPPRLEGLTVKEMSKIIEESVFETLEFLHSEFNIEDDD